MYNITLSNKTYFETDEVVYMIYPISSTSISFFVFLYLRLFMLIDNNIEIL